MSTAHHNSIASWETSGWDKTPPRGLGSLTVTGLSQQVHHYHHNHYHHHNENNHHHIQPNKYSSKVIYM